MVTITLIWRIWRIWFTFVEIMLNKFNGFCYSDMLFIYILWIAQLLHTDVRRCDLLTFACVKMSGS